MQCPGRYLMQMRMRDAVSDAVGIQISGTPVEKNTYTVSFIGTLENEFIKA